MPRPFQKLFGDIYRGLFWSGVHSAETAFEHEHGSRQSVTPNSESYIVAIDSGVFNEIP